MHSSSFGYLLCEGGRNIKGNRQMSIASIGILIACMLLIGIAILFSMNVTSVMGYMEDTNEVIVYIEDDVTQTVVNELGKTLEQDSNIFSCEFVSKEDALQSQMDLMEDAAVLLEGLSGEENPLPASYIVKITELSTLDATVDWINGLSGVDYAAAPTELAKTLVDIKNAVMVVGVFIVAILGTVSVIIIGNTIKVTVFNRRKEISIMKYVGAKDSFIRIPYLVEGMIIGLTSALFSFSFLWIGYEYAMKLLGETTSSWVVLIYDYFIPFMDVASPMFFGFVVAGLSFGILGSLFFVNRYLKV